MYVCGCVRERKIDRERVNDKVCVPESCGGLTGAKHFTVKHAPRTGHVLCIDPYNCRKKIPHGEMVFLPSTLKTTRVFRPDQTTNIYLI